MIWILGALFYILSVYVSYNDTLKSMNIYFYIAALIGVLTNISWFYIAKHAANPSDILVKGFYWDAMIVACYVIVPLLFFEIKLTGFQIAGLTTILLGVILTKL